MESQGEKQRRERLNNRKSKRKKKEKKTGLELFSWAGTFSICWPEAEATRKHSVRTIASHQSTTSGDILNMPLLDAHLEQIALSSNAISDLPYVNFFCLCIQVS